MSIGAVATVGLAPPAFAKPAYAATEAIPAKLFCRMQKITQVPLEFAVIYENSHGYELTDSDGKIIGFYSGWQQIADMFRRENFSEEYIAKRKADISRGNETTIDGMEV